LYVKNAGDARFTVPYSLENGNLVPFLVILSVTKDLGVEWCHYMVSYPLKGED
jgi:hypothetical protein